MKSLLSFVTAPYYCKNHKIDWTYFYSVFFSLLMFIIPLLILSWIAQRLFGVAEVHADVNRLTIILITLVCAPIVEEILFRILLRPLFKNIIIFSSLLWTLALFFFFQKRIPAMSIALILGCSSLILIYFKTIRRLFQKLILKHFSFLFYFSAVLFGMAHIGNFDHYNSLAILVVPVIVAPNILAGLFLGLIRMRFGIFYSVLFHLFINFIALPGLLIQ